MKIRCFLSALSLLLSPALAQASDYVESGSSAIWFLRQLSDLSGDQLPQDLFNVLGKSLIDLEGHGVLIPNEGGKKWVPLDKIVSDLTVFRNNESSEAEIAAVLETKEQIKEGLLKKLSAQWEDGLEDLMKEHRQNQGQWNPGKAYGAGLIAYYLVDISVAWNSAYLASGNAAWQVAGNAARNAVDAAANDAAGLVAWHAAYNAAYNAAYIAAYNASRNTADNARHAARSAVHASVKQKLIVLASKNTGEIGSISYDLAELFTLLWLTENAYEYYKTVFDDTYAVFPEMELTAVKAKIAAVLDAAATENPELNDNMFIKALKRNLDTLEKFVLEK